MPTYQYACTECGHGFETVQSFTDDALTECPQCAGRLRKVFNSVGIVFKGSGFYRTDSREKAATGSSDKADAAPAKDSSKDGAKDSKASSGSSDSAKATTSSTGSPTKSTPSTAGSAA